MRRFANSPAKSTAGLLCVSRQIDVHSAVSAMEMCFQGCVRSICLSAAVFSRSSCKNAASRMVFAAMLREISDIQ